MRMDSERQVTGNDALIEFRHVDKFFNKPEEGQYQVVGDLNIKVRENEFLVLFGPGQCGKSTILNLIAGFEMPTSGEVLCKGKAGFLLAGWNTMPKEKKQSWDENACCTLTAGAF